MFDQGGEPLIGQLALHITKGRTGDKENRFST
jgi:hypothetical protein